MPRRRRGSDDNANWRLRDDVGFYTDQAKAAPGAARTVLGLPKAIAGGLRELVADLRAGDMPPDDPRLAPLHGVGFEAFIAAEADRIQGRPVAAAPEAIEAWRRRCEADSAVATACGTALHRRLRRDARP